MQLKASTLKVIFLVFGVAGLLSTLSSYFAHPQGLRLAFVATGALAGALYLYMGLTLTRAIATSSRSIEYAMWGVAAVIGVNLVLNVILGSWLGVWLLPFLVLVWWYLRREAVRLTSQGPEMPVSIDRLLI